MPLFDVEFLFIDDFPLVQIAPTQRVGVGFFLKRWTLEGEYFSHVGVEFETVALYFRIS